MVFKQWVSFVGEDLTGEAPHQALLSSIVKLSFLSSSENSGTFGLRPTLLLDGIADIAMVGFFLLLGVVKLFLLEDDDLLLKMVAEPSQLQSSVVAVLNEADLFSFLHSAALLGLDP
jgi:hypothetical protein